MMPLKSRPLYGTSCQSRPSFPAMRRISSMSQRAGPSLSMNAKGGSVSAAPTFKGSAACALLAFIGSACCSGESFRAIGADTDRRIFWRGSRRQARRQAFDNRVVVRLEEKGNGETAPGPAERRIGDAMRGRDPEIVGPPHQDVADIDDIEVGRSGGRDPRAIAGADFQAAGVGIGVDEGQRGA